MTQLPADVTDAQIGELDKAGVRALRFNVYRSGSAPLEDLERLAHRVHEVAGWHVELYVDAGDLPGLAPRLRRLPQIAIDHLAMSDDTSGTLIDLVAHGAVVKATGFGRMTVRDPETLMRRVLASNPMGLIFGSDLPSTRARVPFSPADMQRIAEAVGPRLTRAVFADNARRLYRQDPSGVA